MKIGKHFTRRGQRYRFLGERPYWTRGGRYLLLALVEGRCAECGAPFETTATKTAVANGELVRRCKRHRKVGHRLSGKLHPAARAPKPASITAKRRTPRRRPPVALLAAADAARYPRFLL